ncbi:hypothetical protein MJT46_007357 [Ovis ammon polii x Ovis aries]|nr:hypothetical protein MJT46_007357 [Ovis ammon polii x Ovis aries]
MNDSIKCLKFSFLHSVQVGVERKALLPFTIAPSSGNSLCSSSTCKFPSKLLEEFVQELTARSRYSLMGLKTASVDSQGDAANRRCSRCLSGGSWVLQDVQETPEGRPSSLRPLQPSACLTLTGREPRRARASGPTAAPGGGASRGALGPRNTRPFYKDSYPQKLYALSQEFLAFGPVHPNEDASLALASRMAGKEQCNEKAPSRWRSSVEHLPCMSVTSLPPAAVLAASHSSSS